MITEDIFNENYTKTCVVCVLQSPGLGLVDLNDGVKWLNMNVRHMQETNVIELISCVWFLEHKSRSGPLGGNSRETVSDGELQRFRGGFT